MIVSTPTLISSDQINGTTVYNPAGEKLGTVKYMMIDRVSGKVRYAVMEFGGFLGMGKDAYPLPWSTLIYDPAKDIYVVSLTKEQLADAPHYDPNHVPEYTDEFGRRVHAHYGATWTE